MSSGRIEVERFNGTGDYMLWKEKLLAHMEILGLMEALRVQEAEEKSASGLEKAGKAESKGDQSEVESSAKIDDPQMIEKQRKARSTIILSVGDNVLRKIIKEDKAAGMFRILDNLFMSKSLPNRIYLKQKLYSFKMAENESIEGNIDNFMRIITDLGNASVVISDEDQAILLLMSLPRQFDQLRDTLRYGKTELTLDEVTGAIYSKQLELNASGKGTKSYGEGLYVNQKPRGREKSRDKYPNFKKKDTARSNSRQKFGKCYNCGKEGHYSYECRSRPRNNGNNNSSSKGESASVKGNHIESDVLMVESSSSVSTVQCKTESVEGQTSEANSSVAKDFNEIWILDTGCTFHMTPRKDWFCELKEEQDGVVRMANSAVSQVKGIGSIRIKTDEGGSVTITNVRYVPDFSRNLISLGTLEAQGCAFTSENGQLRVKKGCRTLLKADRSESLYLLKGKTETAETNAVTHEDETDLWHKRLGHMSKRGMDLLVRRGYLDSKKVTSMEMCESCIYGKHHKVSFAAGKHVSKQKLDYIHADLWGSPSVPLSLGKCQYFLSLIDDHTRKVWIFFLKTKDQAFEKFQEWKAMVETQTGLKVKKLRTDNGLEFCNREFNEFCAKSGMVRHRTIAYTPQQNGVAERMNRTILDRVRSMLSDSGLGKNYWAEAANTAVYLINRSPSTAIEFKIPEEEWSGHKLDYGNLRRFGSVCYVHSSEGKLQPRAKKAIFLGYPLGVKGYKVWILEDKKTEISRNIVFNEKLCFKDLQEKENEPRLGESQESSGSITVSLDQQVTSEMFAPSSCDNINKEEVIVSESDSEEDTTHQTSMLESTSGLENYVLARDREKRKGKPNKRYSESNVAGFSLLVTENGEKPEPEDYTSAKKDSQSTEWSKAMLEEIQSLHKNHTWDIVKKPTDRKVIGCKWIYKKKPGIPGIEDSRFKARLVAKGFAQKEGIDYNEVFSPVVKHVSIRLLMSIVVNEDLELEQLDVKTAFLHGELEEEIYMDQPEGYVEKGREDCVCLLKKSLYGLKQSPRQWNLRFNQFMLDIGFKRSLHDSCAYIKETTDGIMIYLLLYVDDMLVASRSMKLISELKQVLSTEFEMKDLGAARRILGIEVHRDRKAGTLKLSQEGYLNKVLDTFSMDQAKSVLTPLGSHFKLAAATEDEVEREGEFMKTVPYSSAVGSLMYAMIGSRPDLAYPVGIVSRYMSCPLKNHWSAVKWILRYIKGSASTCLKYRKSNDFKLYGFCDADFAADPDRRRSITGFTFLAGGNVISWKSGLQKVVALSTTESEYMALTEAVKEATWLRGLCAEFGYVQEEVEILCDSQSAVALAKNNVHHERTKHIDVRLHFIRDMIAEGIVKVSKVHTDDNPADIFTKVLPTGKFKGFMNLLGMAQA